MGFPYDSNLFQVPNSSPEKETFRFAYMRRECLRFAPRFRNLATGPLQEGTPSYITILISPIAITYGIYSHSYPNL